MHDNEFECSSLLLRLFLRSAIQAALWLNNITGRRHYHGPRAGRDAAARAAASKLGFAISNRASVLPSFSFRISFEGMSLNGPAPVFDGHAYEPNATDVPLGNVTAILDSYGHWQLELSVPPLTVQVRSARIRWI